MFPRRTVILLGEGYGCSNPETKAIVVTGFPSLFQCLKEEWEGVHSFQRLMLRRTNHHNFSARPPYFGEDLGEYLAILHIRR